MQKLTVAAIIIVILIGVGIFAYQFSSDTNEEKSSSSAKNQSLNSEFLSKYPLLTLVRKNPAEIGCMLESEFSYRDPIFNCDYKNYENKGEPCKKADEYYEGIQIPVNLIKKIHPAIKTIVLDFEKGRLREIWIAFEDNLSKDKIKEMFDLPSERNMFLNNVANIDYGDNVFSNDKSIDPNYTKWLIITGFDHIGGADVECE